MDIPVHSIMYHRYFASQYLQHGYLLHKELLNEFQCHGILLYEKIHYMLYGSLHDNNAFHALFLVSYSGTNIISNRD